MKKMLRWLVNGLLLWMLVSPLAAYAGQLEELEDARKLYLYAAACRAAYSDRVGHIAADALADQGWHIEAYFQSSKKADARFLLAKQAVQEGEPPSCLVVFTGTENLKDVLTDLRFDKVYFAGKTVEEFAINAESKNVPKGAPMVHRGFNQYVQAAFTAEERKDGKTTGQKLANLMLDSADRKIYLIGHSLGGAAATLGGARLLSMGVKPEQIEVITFGAPAVGNAAFKQEFESVLQVTRVVIAGDVVTGVLQGLVGGYEQFGREILWPSSDKFPGEPHDMTLYLDLAIKQYYAKRGQAVADKVITRPMEKMSADSKKGMVYVAPVLNSLPENLKDEFFYMQEALLDEYRDCLPGYVIGSEPGSVPPECQWIVKAEIQGYQIKNEEYAYYITLQQTVCRAADGAIVSVQTYGAKTTNMTPLEALIHNAMSMSGDKTGWSSILSEKGGS